MPPHALNARSEAAGNTPKVRGNENPIRVADRDDAPEEPALDAMMTTSTVRASERTARSQPTSNARDYRTSLSLLQLFIGLESDSFGGLTITSPPLRGNYYASVTNASLVAAFVVAAFALGATHDVTSVHRCSDAPLRRTPDTSARFLFVPSFASFISRVSHLDARAVRSGRTRGAGTVNGTAYRYDMSRSSASARVGDARR